MILPAACLAQTTPAKQPATTEEPAKKDDGTHSAQPKAEPADTKAEHAPAAAKTGPYVLDYTMKTIDGKDKPLADFKGKVVLIVNVASKCGFTPQYEGLEALYKDKKDAGLVILGFPANDFGGQEPGTNQEIKTFCESKYKVDFPMFAKIDVTGPKQDPLYQQLASQPAPVGGDPKWNFTKFLVNRKGEVVARYDSRIKPDDEALRKKLNELLAEK
jgi:glutathione peroxidase